MTAILDLREQSRQHMPTIEVIEPLRQAAIQTWTGRMRNRTPSGDHTRPCASTEPADAMLGWFHPWFAS